MKELEGGGGGRMRRGRKGDRNTGKKMSGKEEGKEEGGKN
jgi:hypothetical protein